MLNTQYESERGEKLFPLSKVQEKGTTLFITTEDYMKWYSLYEVDTELGVVQKLHFHHVEEALKFDGTVQGDHCINPEAVIAYSEYVGCPVAYEALAEITRRWIECHDI